MLRQVRWQIVGVSVIVAGLFVGCKEAPAPLTWATVEGPAGLFTAHVPTSWGTLAVEANPTLLAYASEAARGATEDPLLLQRRGMQEQAGLLLTFDRIWSHAVSTEAWVGYVTKRAKLEVVTHNQLTERTLVDHVREGRAVTFAVRHQSFGSRAYYELVRMEERGGILMTARCFVPVARYRASADDLRRHLDRLEWSEEVADRLLPVDTVPTEASIPSI